MAQYYTLVTTKGTEKIAKMLVTGEKLNLTKMQVGDGGGKYYEPSVKQTALKNPLHTMDVNSIKINTNNPNWITIEGVIPANVGGFYIREVGVFDSDNDLIAIGKYCETYKPTADEGTTKEIIIRAVLDVDNVESVNLTVNPNISYVTQDDLKELEGKQIEYIITSGNSNIYTAIIPNVTSYDKGFGVCAEIHSTNTGKSYLNINGLGDIEILDGNGNSISSGGLKKGIPYNLRYNGLNFILQGKGGGGNAKPEHLLTPYTATTDSGEITGTMKDYSGITTQWGRYNTIKLEAHPSDIGQARLTIPNTDNKNGFYGSDTVITANIFNLNDGNIKAGVKVGRNDGSSDNCITGTFTADGTATASEIYGGKTAYVNGNKVTGTMGNMTSTIQGSANSDAFTNNVITGVASNSYVTGFDFGVTGYVKTPRIHIANLIANNIKEGIKIGGQNGFITGKCSVESMDGRKFATGTTAGTPAYIEYNYFGQTTISNQMLYYVRVEGLSFRPNYIIWKSQNAMGVYFTDSNSNKRVFCVITTEANFSTTMQNSSLSFRNINGETVNQTGSRVAIQTLSNGFIMPISGSNAQTVDWYAVG